MHTDQKRSGFSMLMAAFMFLCMMPGAAIATGPTDPMVYLRDLGTTEQVQKTSSLTQAAFEKWVKEQIDTIKNPEHISEVIGDCLDQLKAVGFVLGLKAGWPDLDMILTTVINQVCQYVQQYWDQLLSTIFYNYIMPDFMSSLLSKANELGFSVVVGRGFSRGGGDCSKDIDGDGQKDCIPVGTVTINTPTSTQTYNTTDTYDDD